MNPLEAWRAKQAPEKDENPALIEQGKTLFATKACSTCHTVRGHNAMGVQGPDLTHIGSRTTIAAGLLENNTEQLPMMTKARCAEVILDRVADLLKARGE